MDTLAHDIMDGNTVFQVVKAQGGLICIGTIRSDATDDDGEKETDWVTRIHIATSEAEVVRQLKFYLRSNLETDNAGEL